MGFDEVSDLSLVAWFSWGLDLGSDFLLGEAFDGSCCWEGFGGLEAAGSL